MATSLSAQAKPFTISDGLKVTPAAAMAEIPKNATAIAIAVFDTVFVLTCVSVIVGSSGI